MAVTARPLAFHLRRVHRALGLLLALFMATIGLTGAAMQAMMIAYGDIQHGGRDLPEPVRSIHQLVFFIHTGAIVRPISDYYGLICALGLLYFSVSGAWMYLRMLRMRRAQGDRRLFWSVGTLPDAAWRTLHRWLTVVLGAFLALLALTAASLNLDYLRFNTYPGGNPADHSPPKGPPGGDWHEFNYAVHKLSVVGAPGHWIGLLVGLGLAGFALSGTMMYGAMLLRRRRSGLKALIW